MTLEEHARNIRRNILEARHKAGMIHYGGAHLAPSEGTEPELASGSCNLGRLFLNREVTSAIGVWT